MQYSTLFVQSHMWEYKTLIIHFLYQPVTEAKLNQNQASTQFQHNDS